jgi:hypothetical protein
MNREYLSAKAELCSKLAVDQINNGNSCAWADPPSRHRREKRERMSKSHPFCRVPIQADDYICECEREGDDE